MAGSEFSLMGEPMNPAMINTPLNQVYEGLRAVAAKTCADQESRLAESAPLPMLLQLIALSGCRVTIFVEPPCEGIPGHLLIKEQTNVRG